MAGGSYDHVIRDGFQIANLHTINLGVRNNGGHVVTRIGTSISGHLREVLEEIHKHGLALLRRRLTTLHIRIIRPKQFLGQFQHAGFIFFWYTQNHHDHTQWVPDRHVLDEIYFVAQFKHAIDGGLGYFLYSGFHSFEVGGHEPIPGEITKQLVIGLIHIDQRS